MGNLCRYHFNKYTMNIFSYTNLCDLADFAFRFWSKLTELEASGGKVVSNKNRGHEGFKYVKKTAFHLSRQRSVIHT